VDRLGTWPGLETPKARILATIERIGTIATIETTGTTETIGTGRTATTARIATILKAQDRRVTAARSQLRLLRSMVRRTPSISKSSK